MPNERARFTGTLGGQPCEPPKRLRTWRPAVFWSVLIPLVPGLIWGAVTFGSDRGQFRWACCRIRQHPEKLVGRQFGMDTLTSCGVSSGRIGWTVDKTYGDFCRAFAVRPATYYSECGDCPTQETIWQFPGYFVRLYATSALECDGADVGVFAGTYEEFRGAQLSSTNAWLRFTPIEYQSPTRFLQSR